MRNSGPNWLDKCVATSILFAAFSSAQGEVANLQTIVLRDVTVFDAREGKLNAGMDVLVVGNQITEILEHTANRTYPDDARIVDSGGRVLLPGLIDTHTHLSIIAGLDKMRNWSWDEIGARMGARASATLQRGFTSVRDLGGPVMGLKRAIDLGVIDGPRIYPSGAFITQTGGHGDFRQSTDPHPRWFDNNTNWERLGYYRLADGVPDVLASVRENLAHGATQIKVMGSGGVSSEFDPSDSLQFTLEELRAAVNAASDWGTYVAAHLHNGPAINRALEAGIMSIDHGYGIDEKGMKTLVKNGAFFNIHFASGVIPLEEITHLTERQVEKALLTREWRANAHKLMKKYKPRITYCVDSLGEKELFDRIQALEFEARAAHFSGTEILQQATINAAELLSLSGNRNPYPGVLGVIEEGAIADLLIVDGDPTQDITLLADPDKNIRLIIKGGEVFKNTLP